MAVDTDKGFVPRRGIMTPEMWQGIRNHYRHAVEKHPYFADRMLDNYDGGPETLLAQRAMKEELEFARARLAEERLARMVKPSTVLECEVAEIHDAYARGDDAAAVEECYDAIAVLLRMVDVLEGRQPLGRPVVSEMETTGTEGGAE